LGQLCAAEKAKSEFSLTYRSSLSGFVQISVADEHIDPLTGVKFCNGILSDHANPFCLSVESINKALNEMLCGCRRPLLGQMRSHVRASKVQLPGWLECALWKTSGPPQSSVINYIQNR
jgi:hypothetical protein